MTMTLVSTVTVGSGGAASIDFTSIPQTATDLLVLVSGRSTNASYEDNLNIKINSSTSGYVGRQLIGSGLTVGSYVDGTSIAVVGVIPGASQTTSTFANGAIYLPNYSGSTNKSFSADVVGENNGTYAYQTLFAGSLSNTAAITSISLTTLTNFAQYSTASLYTITKGSGGATVS